MEYSNIENVIREAQEHIASPFAMHHLLALGFEPDEVVGTVAPGTVVILASPEYRRIKLVIAGEEWGAKSHIAWACEDHSKVKSPVVSPVMENYDFGPSLQRYLVKVMPAPIVPKTKVHYRRRVGRQR